MPRLRPQLVPEFTAEQLAQAQRVALQTSAPHRCVLRAKLTLALAADPLLSHEAIAAKVGLAYATVRKWRGRWAREGWSLEDAPRSGRPPAFSPAGRGGGESRGV